MLRCFALDLTATDSAELTGLSIRSIDPLYLQIRQRLAEECERASPFQGIVEVDDSYFGPHPVPGKRGRVELDSGTPSDSLSSYDGLVDLGYARYLRVHHAQGEQAVGSNHINGIESSWRYAKRRLVKFNGVPDRTFYLHLKACEYRFNHRPNNRYHRRLKLPRERPL